MELSLVIAGAAAGLLVGMTGVGGGALMTPLLLLLGVAPLTAVGSDLWFAAITKLFATRVHHRHGLIDWQVVRRLWLGSLSASALTLLWMRLHPVDEAAVTLLETAIAAAVLLTAAGLLLQKPLHALGRRLRTAEGSRFKTVQAPLTVLAGAVLGMLVTLTSIGAGALGAVFLTYLYPLRLTPPRLIATDIVHAIPLAVFAGIGHLLIGNVEFGLLGNLLLGSIPAVIIGALLSARLPHALLRGVLAVVLLSIGARLWWTGGQHAPGASCYRPPFEQLVGVSTRLTGERMTDRTYSRRVADLKREFWSDAAVIEASRGPDRLWTAPASPDFLLQRREPLQVDGFGQFAKRQHVRHETASTPIVPFLESVAHSSYAGNPAIAVALVVAMPSFWT